MRKFLVFGLLICGCAKSPLSLPLVVPPVKDATPTGLQTTASSLRKMRDFSLESLSSSEFKSRFFTSGPTYIFGILQSIDDKIASFNSEGGSHTCSKQSPVSYTITPWGQSVTMYGQCAQTNSASYSGDPAITIFGVDSDKVLYLWNAGGQSWTAAIVTPISGETGKYSVHAWIGVGYGNGTMSGSCSGSWDDCSYGIIELTANQATKSFEMAVAGIGFGFCGAQYVSDGTNIYGKGSTDMGSTCNSVDTICVEAANASTAATCTTAQQTFALTPLGKLAATSSGYVGAGATKPATWAASAYPSSPNAAINGTSTDALRFGPTTVPSGIGAY